MSDGKYRLKKDKYELIKKRFFEFIGKESQDLTLELIREAELKLMSRPTV